MIGSRAIPFEPGQTVVLGAGPEPARRWYRTIVQHVDSRVVWVDGAPEGQPTVEVQPGQYVTCHTWRSMDALYQADARVAFARLAPEARVGLTILNAERVQQRAYVRVPLSSVATGVYLRPEPGADRVTAQALHLHVHDLSAGGLRGRSDFPLVPGDELTLSLRLPPVDDPRPDQEQAQPSGPDGPSEPPLQVRGRVVALRDLPEPLNLRARVVRVVETVRPTDLIPEIGVVFMDLAPEARERIIHFALDVQRERRRRGML